MNSVQAISELSIFGNLPPQAIQALAANMVEKRLQAGEVLFSQGDPGDAFYVVVSGRLSLHLRQPDGLETMIGDLGPGECVGEMSVLTGQPRTTSVTAAEKTGLLCLSKADMDDLAKIHPDLITRLIGELLPRFQQTRTNLIVTRLFGELDGETLCALQRKLEWRSLESGQVLCRQGEPGNEMYVVVQGRLRFTDESDAGIRELGEVGAGEMIGEFALLAESGTPESLRSATVSALRVTDVIVIPRPVFENLLRENPQILLKLTRRIIRRSLQISQASAPGVSALVIAVLPTQPHQTVGEFSRQLADALAAQGDTLFWDQARFDGAYGKPGASQTPLDHPVSPLINAWLDEHENQHQYVVYEASHPLDDVGRLTPWARRCAEDADIILLVGDDRSSPAPGAIEAGIGAARIRARLELALVHPASCQMPSGTLAWLTPRRSGAVSLQAHHHVRLGNLTDFRRLARRLTGCPVALTLGGGGARGWAHVGALRALEEARVEVDWVGGASMGAIIAAGYAMDWPVEKMRQLAAIFSDPKKLIDYTLPYASLTATRRITTLLQQLFGESQIEDAWRPYFCVSANLTRGEEQTHTSGLIWKYVRASMAFPGVFAPIFDEGCVLIDGGAANNLPVDRMRELCPTGTVIGVDLCTNSPVSGQYSFGSSLSGWDILFSRLNPFAKTIQAPHLVDIVSGIVYSNNRYRLNEIWRSADLLIRVPAESYGLLEFDKYAEIIETGYTSTHEQIKGFSPGQNQKR